MNLCHTEIERLILATRHRDFVKRSILQNEHVHFEGRFQVDQIETRLTLNGGTNCWFADVEIYAESLNEGHNVDGTEVRDQICIIGRS